MQVVENMQPKYRFLYGGRHSLVAPGVKSTILKYYTNHQQFLHKTFI